MGLLMVEDVAGGLSSAGAWWNCLSVCALCLVLHQGAATASAQLHHPMAAAAPATSLPPWAQEFQPGSVLQTAVDEAISSGKRAVVELPAGDFYFGAAPFVIRGAIHLLVRGQGTSVGSATSLWFDPGAGVEILDCVNTTVQGFSMDTIDPPFSQGQLRAFDTNGPDGVVTAVVDIEEGFPLPTPSSSPLFNETCPDGSEGVCGEVKMIYWDPTTRYMVQGQQMNSPITTTKTVCAKQRCNVTLLQPATSLNWRPPAHSLVTFSPRVDAGKFPIPTYYKGTLAVLNCSRTLLQDIDTYSAGDMTRLECLGFGRNTYRNVNIRRRASPPYAPRLLASNSDGFHSFSVEHGPLLEDCEISYIADVSGRRKHPAGRKSAVTTRVAFHRRTFSTLIIGFCRSRRLIWKTTKH